MKIIGVNGSRHRGHVYGLLVRALASAEKAGAKTEILHLSQNKAQRAQHLLKILDADGFIFATPVHWFNCSARMKDFIDALSVYADPPFPLEEKVAAFLAGCNEDGGQQAINAMLIPLNHMGVIILPFACVFHNSSMEGRSQDNWQETEVDNLGTRMVEFLNGSERV